MHVSVKIPVTVVNIHFWFQLPLFAFYTLHQRDIVANKVLFVLISDDNKALQLRTTFD